MPLEAMLETRLISRPSRKGVLSLRAMTMHLFAELFAVLSVLVWGALFLYELRKNKRPKDK
jgi:hypothetical protein